MVLRVISEVEYQNVQSIAREKLLRGDFEQMECIVFSVDRMLPQYVAGQPEAPRFSGGLADRMKGIVHCFLIARALGKAFFVDWHHPEDCRTFLRPNKLDWQIDDPDQIRPYCNVLDLGHPLKKDLHQLLQSGPTGWQTLFCEAKPYFTHLSSYQFKHLAKNFEDVDTYHNMGLGSEFDRHDTFFRVFQYLFADADIPEIVSSKKEFAKWKSGYQHVIGIQFRVGGEQSWKDQSMDSLSNVPKLVQAVKQAADQLNGGSKNQKIGVYITSDNEECRNAIAAELEAEFGVFLDTSEVVHINRSPIEQSKQGQLNVAIAHLHLSNCSVIIHGAGGFGLTAAMRGNISAYDYRRLSA